MKITKRKENDKEEKCREMIVGACGRGKKV